MREIKFRAWNGFKMYVPSLFNQNENGLFTETGSKGVFKGDSNKQILMQYTGLKDKNGKEIWEGDIVNHLEEKIIIEDIRELPDDVSSWADVDYEIIGNIHENNNLIN